MRVGHGQLGGCRFDRPVGFGSLGVEARRARDALVEAGLRSLLGRDGLPDLMDGWVCLGWHELC